MERELENMIFMFDDYKDKAFTNKQVNKEREIDDWYIRQRGGR